MVELLVVIVVFVIVNFKEFVINKFVKIDLSVFFICVDIEKVDNLINLVGELVII